ncbi:MAG: DUF692 domain-containing protein [Chitinophagales bacterium]|jgi:uncharacterized protein (UPF0276 family)|nr:DUF692 domain-containing protein [Chitinophagales bacterium]
MYSTLAINPYPHLLTTALPLLEAGKVEALEWSFDTLPFPQIPEWFQELLQTYSQKDRLIGHGVFFGLMKGNFSQNQQEWLNQLKGISKKIKFHHISEHFGYFSGRDFHSGAPLPVPMNKITLDIGIDRLQRIQEASECPVGLENLAFAGNIEEVKYHGEFLDKLLSPVQGFIVLDLHNIYCQMVNFDLRLEEILASYPLNKVREIHISGGSWDTVSSLKKIRRDTHDDSVPTEVMTLLKKTIPLCPCIEFITLEQMDYALITDQMQQNFRNDFEEIQKIVFSTSLPKSDLIITNKENSDIHLYATPIESEELNRAQELFSTLLEDSDNLNQLKINLFKVQNTLSILEVNQWQDDMLETAMRIAKKWR